ncbi:MAG: hypothetical protein MUE60_14980 [Candidatus Eisenbacteria bacterium]|nr:hypothetical protein [Candidatus Eisenbacteria bacterium]
MSRMWFQRWRFTAGSVAVVLACTSLAVATCTPQKVAMTVRDAYELRMAGHADSAMAGLQSLVATDSTNAAAWYEMARTEHHIGLGNPQELFDRLERVDRAVEMAALRDPQNVTYRFYKGYVKSVLAYASLMRQQPDARDRVNAAVSALESLVSLNPDYVEPMLFLVELLSVPPGMGGDSAKADAYAQKLEALDGVLGAKAREIHLADGVDKLAYWQAVLAAHEGNAEVLEQLGKACLYRNDIEQGTTYIEDALTADPKKQTLLLDLARYHMMRARSDEQARGAALDIAAGFVTRYLSSSPIPPLRAYALGLSAMIESGKDNRDGVEEYRRQAAAIDPHFSKAFGIPPQVLFIAPDEVPHYHSYFFRPL